MTPAPARSPRRLVAGAASAALLLTGLGVIGIEHHAAGPARPTASRAALLPVADDDEDASASDGGPRMGAESAVAGTAVRRVARLPGGGTRIFGRHRFLVAYYGTAGTGALGVLGETAPDGMHRLLRLAGRPFVHGGERLQPVYELIVTVADATAGPDGDFSHDISADSVRTYIEAAHRHGALVVLDIQPGRADFLAVAKRWAWALEDPWVGLALDPEWRMGPHQVPGRVIGSVGAAEVNAVSAWLADLVERQGLPEKAFVLHQFRTTMIRDVERVRVHEGLAMVQHADGFGTQEQKLATYHVLARPGQFAMGFKLFYDEDLSLLSPGRVRRIRPAVRFVSYQ